MPKSKRFLVVGLLVVGCGFSSAQTFGFASIGGGLYCNYIQLTYAGSGAWSGVDNFTVCGGPPYSAISGFSASGGTSLDLADIGFAHTGQATFSGTSSSGVLTVADGTHTAHIRLNGDYLGSTFTASSDGHGGTIVVAGPPPLAMVSAMAMLGVSAAPHIPAGETGSSLAPSLVRPGGASR